MKHPFVPRPYTDEYAPSTRRHQGIPGVEILPSGRLFATWYAGFEPGEGPGDYVPLNVSDDGGRSWRTVCVTAPVDPSAERAFDPVLWLDPTGRLWWFWAQTATDRLGCIFDGRSGVWAVYCEAPDADALAWSPPRRLADGVMMNKPTVLADGAWLLPVSLWSCYPDKIRPGMDAVSKANLLRTDDGGRSFELLVGPRIADPAHRSFDEHMVVERGDGSWWMLIRGNTPGIHESVSRDRGRSWSEPVLSPLGGPSSRFAVRRLKSGNLALINHRVPHRLPGEAPARDARRRDNLTAWLSADDGETWKGGLSLDTREPVSYPDLALGDDGFLYAVYDHARTVHGQILMARFTEADILAGDLVTPGSGLRLLVDAFVARVD